MGKPLIPNQLWWMGQYCWCFRYPKADDRLDVQNLVNHGINYQLQLVSRISSIHSSGVISQKSMLLMLHGRVVQSVWFNHIKHIVVGCFFVGKSPGCTNGGDKTQKHLLHSAISNHELQTWILSVSFQICNSPKSSKLGHWLTGLPSDFVGEGLFFRSPGNRDASPT